MTAEIRARCDELVEALEFHGEPVDGRELRAAFLDYSGEKFSSVFPNPASGITFDDFMRLMIKDNDLPISYQNDKFVVITKKPTRVVTPEPVEATAPVTVLIQPVEHKERTITKPVACINQSETVNKFPVPSKNIVTSPTAFAPRNNIFQKAIQDIGKVHHLPEKLVDFYTSLGKELQCVDSSKIDELSAQFGRTSNLKPVKYGFKSAKDLLLAIPGFEQSTSSSSSILKFTNPLQPDTTLDENNNVISQNHPEIPEFITKVRSLIDKKGLGTTIQYCSEVLKFISASAPTCTAPEDLTENEISSIHSGLITNEMCKNRFRNFQQLQDLAMLTLQDMPDNKCKITEFEDKLNAKFVEIIRPPKNSLNFTRNTMIKIGFTDIRHLIYCIDKTSLTEKYVILQN